jgi:hypothetical protein
MTTPPASAELSAAVLLDENTLLVLGHGAAPLPAAGTVRFGNETRVGSFLAVSWTDKGHSWFLATLKVEQVALLSLRRAALVDDEGNGHPLPLISRLALEPRELAQALAPTAARNLATVVGFLRDQPAAARALAVVLAGCAEPAGFVEIFGRLRGDELYLQGWSRGLPGGAAELLFETERCHPNPAQIATYTRPDLSAPAHGVGIAVRVKEAFEPRDVRRIYYCQGDTYCRLDVFENRLLWGDQESAAHVAAILPQLQADPETQQTLRRMAAPRYQGEETVSTLAAPVRLAFDLAAQVPGDGVFLAGWMLDPESQVEAIHVGGTNGTRARIDQRWTRTPRPDVSQGYAADPLFAGRLRPGDDAHGFLVFVPCADAQPGELYLELSLRDGRAAFMPLRPIFPTAAEVRRILSSFDVHHPDVERIVDRHIGPVVTAAGRSSHQAVRPSAVYAFGESQPARLSVIVPVTATRTDIDVTMARLAVEPSLAGIELILAAPPAAAAAVGPMLPRQARFYGLSGRLVAGEAGDMVAAMALGASVANSELLLFIGPSVLPRQTGWLAQLERLLTSVPRAGAISPTLLYEDFSVRFAGARASGWAPPDNVTRLTAFSGYARHWLARDAARSESAVPVHAIAGDCCLIHRSAYDLVGGFSSDLVGPDFKALDLSLKLRAARLQCLWAPGIEMLAPDEAAGEPEYWVRTGALVDRWGFARKWSTLFNKKDVA